VISPRFPATAFPPFVAGASVAVAAEIAGGLLLYSGLGFLQALSIILATEAVALGLGFWSVAGVGPERFVETLRGRWLFVLVAFVVAAVYSAGWEILGGFSADPWSQGAGLAMLAALPLFAGGGLLGLLGREESALGGGEDGFPPPASSALFGAAAGFLLTGFLLLRELPPTTMLLGCVIVLSAGALVHGQILGSRARAPRDGAHSLPDLPDDSTARE
jgi:hypothetical protein